VIPSTLTGQQAAQLLWDVLIVGAGPAGSATAIAARREGLRVLIVDRSQFPRWKVCGCCINARALRALQALGVGDLPAKHGAVPTVAMHLASGRATARLDIAGGVALSRERFDAALIEAAIDRGASFLSGVDASAGVVEAGLRTATLREGEQSHSVAARMIVLATGLADRLTDAATSAAIVARHARIGAATVLSAHEAGDAWQRGRIYMAVGRGGYVGAVRLEDDRLEIAASFDPAASRPAGGPGPLATKLFSSAGWRVEANLATALWRGTPYLTRRRTRLGAERVLMVGDAAGYVEPFTGEGMAWALQGGAMLGPHLRDAATDWSPNVVVAWERAYRQALSRRHTTCRWVTRLLRRPMLTAGAIRALALWPSAGRSVVRSIAPAAGFR
jgi:flavin-dependent dehydrogenase